MANISDATGIINIEGQWTEDQIKSLSYVLFFQNAFGDYGFQFMNFDDVYQSLIKERSLPFTGTGRWSFTSNLQYFNEWTDLSKDSFKFINKNLQSEEQITYDQYYKHRMNTMKALTSKDRSLDIVFADYEPGADMAYQATGSIVSSISYDTTTKEVNSKFEYLEASVQQYDCNLKFYTEYILQGDLERLWNVCHFIITNHYPDFLNAYKESSIDKLIEFVMKDPQWYDLNDYIYDELEQVPEEIQNFLSNMVKGG
jgi:hypothetical protein